MKKGKDAAPVPAPAPLTTETIRPLCACGAVARWKIGAYIPFRSRASFLCDDCYKKRFPKCPRCRQTHSCCRCDFDTF